MSANHTPNYTSYRQARNRSVPVGAAPPHENTYDSTVSYRSTSSAAHYKTWEYNNQPADKLAGDVKANWRLDKSFTHASVAALRPRFENPHNISPSFQPRAPRLGLSTIKTVISFSPTKETPPSPYHEAPPKDQANYEYAITGLLSKADNTDRILDPGPTDYDQMLAELHTYTDHLTQPMPPRPDDQISYVGSDVPNEDKNEEMPEDGIPAYLKKHDAYKTRMRLVQLRTLLMRCQVLQSTMNNVERKPWTQSVGDQTYTHYSKMRKMAYRARELAERLQSRELQARCEYWTGRGDGGTKDFEAAAEHFDLAIKLDVENDAFPSKRPMLRGLRPNEKADVHFLLSYAGGCEQEWRKRTEHVRKAALIEAEATKRPVTECLDWGGISRPAWLPERDRILKDVKLPISVSAPEATTLKFSDMSFELQQQQLEALHITEVTRKQLSGAESRYIQRGSERSNQRKDSLGQPALQRTAMPPPTQSGNVTPSQISSMSLYTVSALQVSFSGPRNLEDELEGLDKEWNSRTPSSSGSFRFLTTESQRQQRRNISLGLINTDQLHRRVSLGEAVYGEDPEAQL